jgi:hypothetical protein
MDPQTAIAQLTWYFQRAESECGNRTTMGAHLAMQEAGLTFSGVRGDAEANAASRLDRWLAENADGDETLLRSVLQRLQQLPVLHRCVLEAAYADVRPVGDGADAPSVTLACATDEAEDAYAKAGTTKTRREWLNELCAGKSVTETLRRIVAEARMMRAAALKAYCETKLAEDDDVKRAEAWADMDRDERIRLETLEEFAEAAAPWHDQMLYGHGMHVDDCGPSERERVVVWRCKGCGTDFPTVVHPAEGGRPQEYCSKKCKNRSDQRAHRERLRAAPAAA